MIVRHLEDCVYTQKLMGIDGLATVLGIAGQQTYIDSAPIELACIGINLVVNVNDGSDCLAVGMRWRKVPPVADFIPNTSGSRGSACDLGKKSWNGVGRPTRGSICIGHANGAQLCQRGVRIRLDIVGDIDGMKPINA